ncbi:uncharacterized protein LOC114318342 [Camellia sinensis]|uniref:uncharacterized protein LOC114318342 n=1 Tax=Camellia sinensis TaxID=4442 RepID=UPI00103686EE|nr:uncharacterized protein LOC114318342 [Camellia sinensis]
MGIKIKSIMEMTPPHSQKALKKFLGKVSYLRRFIPALAKITFSFETLLKGNHKFEWLQEHQQAFDMVKQVLTSPLTMIALQPEKSLLLYLTSTPRFIGALLVRGIDGVEKLVYHISYKFNSVESRYTPIERHYLALIFTTQKLHHYFLAHPIQVVTRSDPVRYLLSKPALMGRMAQWILALVEYEITCVMPKAIKSQALADLLAQFPSSEHKFAEAEYEVLILGLIAAQKESLRPIVQQSKCHRWILATTEVSTKWLEVILMRKADKAGAANFIKENIIYRFGISKVMLSDNGAPPVNCHVGRLLDTYQIKHHKSTMYYPQGNRQAEQSKCHRWILTTTEVSIKWLEVIPMGKVDEAGATNFIKENIIYRFGIPKVMLSDNGTRSVNCHVGRLLDTYQIKHHKSTLYYPQGNRQAEVTNKTLIRILSKMMDEVWGTWFEQLPVAL